MYAVIRAGGKQYRVAPGDVIRVEKAANDNGRLEFTDDVLAVGNDGELGRKQGARVAAEVVGEGLGDKVLVFHYKRKKQYKKLQGHRQPFTAIRITEIAFDGQSFKAPDQPKREAKPKKQAEPAEHEHAAAEAKHAKPKAAAKKSSGKKSSPAKKGTSKKK